MAQWQSSVIGRPASVQTVANGKPQTLVRVRQAMRDGAKRTESSRNRGGSSKTADAARMTVERYCSRCSLQYRLLG